MSTDRRGAHSGLLVASVVIFCAAAAGDDAKSFGRGADALSADEFVRACTLKAYADVRGCDLSRADPALVKSLIPTFWFNQETIWPGDAGVLANQVMQAGRNPGLGVRELHKQGITGKGVYVAIIDQPLYLDHPQFSGRFVSYMDTGCDSWSSMHGPAVASLLVGKNTGTAPGARLYYAAAPSWLADSAYYARALDWIVQESNRLPTGSKIRVVSVSAAPSGRGSPFTKNTEMWDAACQRAEAAGIVVLDCTEHRGIIGPCVYDPASPDDVTKCTPGFADSPGWYGSSYILCPVAPRTQAEEYLAGIWRYQYTGNGGLSWGIPYAAGLMAMGWQVNPNLTGSRIVELLRKSAYQHDDGLIADPAEFIRQVRESVRSD